MNRKSVFLLALLCALSLFAHAIPPIRVGRAVARATNTVAARSARANKKAVSRLKKFTKLADSSTKATLKPSDPALLRRSVFEVQISETGRHTASAFALKVNGRTWGITAGHVMENIRSNPFAKVRTEAGNILAPISFFRIGNRYGNDVAIFEIPQEILPHVEVLSPAEKLPEAGVATESPAFIHENYMLMPTEEIVFAGQHRILLKDQLRQNIDGFCGSPVLAGGKVVGLHRGAYPLSYIQKASWNSLLYANNLSLSTPLHIATPIQNALRLIEEVTMQSDGLELKVFDHPVHTMTSQERIFSITQMRNGFAKQKIHAHPFMNFERLEEFFELQENDVLHIELESPPPYFLKTLTKIYDVNVSTGEVNSFIRRGR